MLYAIGVALLGLWFLAFAVSYTLGGFISLVLVLGLVFLMGGFFEKRWKSTWDQK
jgi:hypothetical protein